MYEGFFGLRRRPFAAIPDVECFAPLGSANEVLAEVVHCLQGARGIAVLSAAAGLGKTLLCRRVARELNDTWATVLLTHSGFPTRRSLLQAILHELGRPCARLGDQELRHELQSAARNVRPARRGVVVIVDEAHLLSERLLEELRSLTNMIDGGEPLFEVMLSGQMGLEEMLAGPAVEPFRQRIACQVTLEPLTQAESAAYLDHYASWAGSSLSALYTPDAVRLICHASDGLPRCLNQLADHSLLLGCVMEEKPVSEGIVTQALDDLRQLPLHWNQPSRVPTPMEQMRGRQTPETEIDSDEVEAEVELSAPSPARNPAPFARSVESRNEFRTDAGSVGSLEVGFSLEVGASEESAADAGAMASDETPTTRHSEDFEAVVTIRSEDSAAIEIGAMDPQSAAWDFPGEVVQTPASAPTDEIVSDPWDMHVTELDQFEGHAFVESASWPMASEGEVPASAASIPAAAPDGQADLRTQESVTVPFVPTQEPRTAPPMTSDVRMGANMPSEGSPRRKPPAEETIFDRYALLDAGLPIPEALPADAEVAEAATSQRTESIPAWMIGSFETNDMSPDERIDRIAPLLEEALSGGMASEKSAGIQPLSQFASESRRTIPTAETVVPRSGNDPDRDADDALGEAVLEECLETLRTVHPESVSGAADSRKSQAAMPEVSERSTSIAQDANVKVDARRASQHSAFHAGHAMEESPRKYSQLFSALRKKFRRPE